MQFKKTKLAKLYVLILIISLFFLAKIKYKQWQEQQAIEHEKNTLKEQVAQLQKKNQDFSDSLSYFGSNSFKERVAREQLDLKRQGEVVFGFSEPESAQIVENQSEKISNPEKWITYFFKKNEH
jgi:cell division protein FtsB